MFHTRCLRTISPQTVDLCKLVQLWGDMRCVHLVQSWTNLCEANKGRHTSFSLGAKLKNDTNKEPNGRGTAQSHLRVTNKHLDVKPNHGCFTSSTSCTLFLRRTCLLRVPPIVVVQQRFVVGHRRLARNLHGRRVKDFHKKPHLIISHK